MVFDDLPYTASMKADLAAIRRLAEQHHKAN
jgi:hypothetical protein